MRENNSDVICPIAFNAFIQICDLGLYLNYHNEAGRNLILVTICAKIIVIKLKSIFGNNRSPPTPIYWKNLSRTFNI